MKKWAAAAGMLFWCAAAIAAPPVDERPGAEGEWGWRPIINESISVNPPRFSWRPQAGAKSYIVEASRDPGFAKVDYHADAIEFNVHAPDRVFPAGEWSWRV